MNWLLFSGGKVMTIEFWYLIGAALVFFMHAPVAEVIPVKKVKTSSIARCRMISYDINHFIKKILNPSNR